MWAWGYNLDGELGHGDKTSAKKTRWENAAEPGDAQVRSSCTNSPTPVEVSELGGVAAVTAGSAHGLALREDGTVWARVLTTKASWATGERSSCHSHNLCNAPPKAL